MLIAIAAFALFGGATLIASRLRDVVRLAALFGVAWAGHAGNWQVGLLTGAVPAFLAILAADALLRRSPVVRLAAQDRRRPVQLLEEHHAGELVREGQRTEREDEAGGVDEGVGQAA